MFINPYLSETNKQLIIANKDLTSLTLIVNAISNFNKFYKPYINSKST